VGRLAVGAGLRSVPWGRRYAAGRGANLLLESRVPSQPHRAALPRLRGMIRESQPARRSGTPHADAVESSTDLP
jgi:hypothetical protein